MKKDSSHAYMVGPVFPQTNSSRGGLRSGTRPTDDISIEFEIQWTFAVL